MGKRGHAKRATCTGFRFPPPSIWRWSPATSQVAYESESYTTNRLDQYTTVSGQAYSYDLNGNLVSDGARTFTYTSQNQLLTATTLSGGTAQYSYDPAARRVRKHADSVGTDFLHAGAMEIAEYDTVSGALLRRYIPGPGIDQRVAVVECGAGAGAAACAPGGAGVVTRHYAADRLGNVLAVLNPNGALHQRFSYTPFGVEMEGDPSGNPFRYTGQRYDPETGLHYYRARYYDANLGRFLQVDPIGYEDQWNLYAYVHNNPLTFTDPTGMECVTQDDYSAVCTPPGGNIGTFTIPAEFNPGYIGPDRSGYHVYFAEASTASSGNISESIAQAVIDNPTPGRDSPATPAGVVNDAGISPLSGPHGDQVVSFTTQDSNGNTLVVNVTIQGQHFLNPGYVAQAIVPGDNRTAIFVVGEGNARIQQGPGSALGGAVFQRKIEGDIRRGILNSTRRR